MIRRANRSSDSSPTSVEESAAAEQQHHEDDDEQRGRVHYSLPCVWRAWPCVIAFHLTLDERRRCGALAGQDRTNSMCRLTAGAGWCLFPSEQSNTRSPARVGDTRLAASLAPPRDQVRRRHGTIPRVEQPPSVFVALRRHQFDRLGRSFVWRVQTSRSRECSLHSAARAE